MYNSFILNNYQISLKVFRLTCLAVHVLFCLLNISCSNPPQNQQISLETRKHTDENAVNLNTATESDLEKLPKIGKGIAKRIVAYREEYGNFQRAEHLLLVRGISDKKFREIQSLIKAE